MARARITADMNRTILIAVILVSCGGLLSAEKLVRIHAKGFVTGTTMETRNGRPVWVYLGIPYAKPPVGDLRFKDPVPKEAWQGILRAVDDSPQCPQSSESNTPWNEDCLYLNVYVPRRYKNVSELLPVMVSIHGGAFLLGNSSSSTMGPEYLLDKDVILVSMNYRLGILGFLTSGDDAAPGNFGLKDQNLALRWVQEHILAFGGNPKRVTIFGESAGGVSVNFHAASYKSKGLFQKYIIQSGSMLTPWAFRERTLSVSSTIAVAKRLNCSTIPSTLMIDCLRKISVDELLGISTLSTESVQLMPTYWLPTNEHVHEDAFMTDVPLNLLSNMKDGPLITGVVRDEGLLATVLFHTNEALYKFIVDNLSTLVIPEILNMIAPNADIKALTEEIMKFYFNGEVSSDKEHVLKQITDFVTDLFFVYPQVAMMKYLAAETRIPFYFYSFEYRGTFSHTSISLGSNQDIGISHADDEIYLFPFKPAAHGLPNLSMTADDYKVVDTMVDLWTSLAINSVPISNTIQGGKFWPMYRDSDVYLRIGSNSDPTSVLKTSFLVDRMSFWAKLMPM